MCIYICWRHGPHCITPWLYLSKCLLNVVMVPTPPTSLPWQLMYEPLSICEQFPPRLMLNLSSLTLNQCYMTPSLLWHSKCVSLSINAAQPDMCLQHFLFLFYVSNICRFSWFFTSPGSPCPCLYEYFIIEVAVTKFWKIKSRPCLV